MSGVHMLHHPNFSFCNKNTQEDPEFLSGKYSGDKDMIDAKKKEGSNKRTVGLLVWEQQMRKIHGKSSSIKVRFYHI